MLAFVRGRVRFGSIRGDSSGRNRSIAMQIRIVRLNRLVLNKAACPLELSLESRYGPVESSPTARDQFRSSATLTTSLQHTQDDDHTRNQEASRFTVSYSIEL